MIDIKQNRDLIIVKCNSDCNSVLRLYASCIHSSLSQAIKFRGWTVKGKAGYSTIYDRHYCRACVRKGEAS